MVRDTQTLEPLHAEDRHCYSALPHLFFPQPQTVLEKLPVPLFQARTLSHRKDLMACHSNTIQTQNPLSEVTNN